MAPIYNIIVRRVQQIIKHYKEKGRPELKSWRRPRTYLSDEHKESDR